MPVVAGGVAIGGAVVPGGGLAVVGRVVAGAEGVTAVAEALGVEVGLAAGVLVVGPLSVASVDVTKMVLVGVAATGAAEPRATSCQTPTAPATRANTTRGTSTPTRRPAGLPGGAAGMTGVWIGWARPPSIVASPPVAMGCGDPLNEGGRIVPTGGRWAGRAGARQD